MGDEEGFQNANEMASGTFWGLVGNGLLKLVSFLYVIYVARAVSQNDIGLFYLAFSIIGLFGAWKTLGLPAALTRYVPYFEARGEEGKARMLFQYSLAINAIIGAGLAAIVWLSSDVVGALYQNPGLPEALRLLAFFVFLDNVFSTMGSFLQGRADIKSAQMMSNAQNISKFVLTFALFQTYGANLAAMCAAFVISYVFSIAISSKMVYSSAVALPAGKGKVSSRELWGEIAPFGLMLTVISILWTVVSYSDRVILGFFVPPSEANEVIAIYSMAISLALNVMIFPATVGGIFMPTISRLVGKNDLDGIRKSMATSQRWILFITLPFTIVMIVFSKEMLSVFYGGQYGGGGAAMAIFCIGLLFSVFSYVFALALAGMRLVSLEFKIASVVVLINIVLCFLFIPYFGIEGAALAAAVSFLASAVLFSHYGWKMIRYAPPSEVYKIIGAAALVCALLLLLKPAVAFAASSIPPFGGEEIRPYVSKIAYLLLLGAVSAFSFSAVGLLSLLAKCFGREDLHVMKQVAKKAKVPQSVIGFAERIMLFGIREEK